MREDNPIHHAVSHQFLEASLGVFLIIEYIMVAENETFVSIQPAHDMKMLALHGDISQKVHMVLLTYH